MKSKEQFKRKGKKVYSIIVDGHTEKWYFELLKQYEQLRIDIKPELITKKKLNSQFEDIKDAVNHYDKVIWVVDLDTILKEDNERKKGTKPKLQVLSEYLARLNKPKYQNVEVLFNAPCLEFWLLLHLKYTNKYFPNYDSVIKEFDNTVLSDYEKTDKFYKKYGNDIYTKLKPLQEKAIKNAEKLGDFDFTKPETAKAEIYKIIKELLILKTET